MPIPERYTQMSAQDLAALARSTDSSHVRHLAVRELELRIIEDRDAVALRDASDDAIIREAHRRDLVIAEAARS